ncbi:MAG: DUF1592 domain-containing protein [Prosthecobacter sp.]
MLLLAASSAVAEEAPATSQVSMPRKHFAFFEKYCVDCHDDTTEKGNLDLYKLSFDLGTLESAEMWQKILNSLNSGEMPPEKKPQPTNEDKTAFLEILSGRLVDARALLSDTGGEITMRRLNRREYENTIEALLGIQVDASDLPSDANSGGFDTAGGSLFFSSDQFEQYLKIAHRVLDEAIVTTPKPQVRKVRVEAETNTTKATAKRLAAMDAQMERAKAWHESGKEPRDFGFVDAAEVAIQENFYKRDSPPLRAYLGWPETKTGAVLHTLFGGAFILNADIPTATPSGRYMVRFKAAVLNDKVPFHQRFIEYGTRLEGQRGGELSVQGCVHIKGTMADPQVVEIPITLTNASPRYFGIRERQINNRDFARLVFSQAQAKNKPVPDPAIWVDWIEWEGPPHDSWPPKSHEAVFFKPTDTKLDETYVREILVRFATKAFRARQPSDSFIDKLMAIYQAQLEMGAKPLAALKEPLAVILASPGFLYLTEPVEKPWFKENGKPLPKRVPLTKREFAIRLAYFLWSAPPDDELFKLAMDGELRKPEVLRQQTQRMLNDPRAFEFISGFTHQWLDMERLDFFNYNFRSYPQFDESVKDAARNEVYHTIRTVIDENRPIGDLLNPDFLVVNDVLSNYYGLGRLQGGVNGAQFRSVPVPADSKRGGLLTMAAILAMGSDGERTSPVERGAWIMRKLLNNPPPPAPPNVPQLSRNADKIVGARELLNLHMEEAQCAQCHRRIDPLGFGLEHFNAVGLWREQELVQVPTKRKATKARAFPIDSSGTLPDGTPFTDSAELRAKISARKDDFARGFTEHLIEYGLGRPFGFKDLNLADQIISRAKEEKDALSAYIHALVQSRAFRLK